MRVRPSGSWKVRRAAERREGGGWCCCGEEGGGGKVRKTKVEGWRVGLREARRWGRDVEPVGGGGVVILVDGLSFGIFLTAPFVPKGR